MQSLPLSGAGPLELLFIGAHCDDIDIGCGGTAIELATARPDASITWVVLSSNDVREAEARDSAARLLSGVNDVNVIVKNYRNSYFPYVGAEIKEFFEQLKQSVNPNVIFTHYKDDLHQDHRLVGELTWNTWRDHLIYEYEIPKYDGGLGSPNAFVALERDSLDAKIDVLLSAFVSQRSRAWFTDETFRGLARLRGIECNAQSGFAEAFYCRKSLIGF